MSQSPLIHIGYHKTGSNFFQNNFYPMVKNGTYTHRDLIRKHLLCIRPNNFSSARCRKKLNISRKKRVLICEENLSGSILSGGHFGFLTHGIAKRLHECFPQAQIVIFVRNQFEIIPSTWGEYIKRGGTYSFSDFLKTHENQVSFRYPEFHLEHFKYHGLIQKYQTLFGSKNVHVYLYENFRRNNKKFLKKFAGDLNLTIDINELELSKKNPSLNTFGLIIQRFFNYFSGYSSFPGYRAFNIPGAHRFGKRIGYMSNNFFKNKQVEWKEFLTPENKEKFREIFHECNMYLAEKLGLGVSKHGYPLKCT